ncbi:unnamed protein product [Closterium sp. Yama58-4]|nr:unnamed protein product [Closterium sp. Yama58-4]
MSAKKVGQAVQADWDNREFVESLRLNIHRIYTFVNDFEASAKGRLAALNSKLTSLERQLTYLEAQVLSAGGAGGSVWAAGGMDEGRRLAPPGSVAPPDERVIPASRRPDGTMRKEIRVRAGYVAQEEVATYVARGSRPKGSGPELPPGMDPELAAEMQKKKAAAAKKKKKAQGAGGAVSSAAGASDRRSSAPQEANSQLAEAMDELTVSGANKHGGGAGSRADSTQSGSDGAVGGKAEIEKKIRALKKKIRQAEALESANNLSPEQVEKLKKLPDWRSEVEAMEQQLATM